ncbi:MAG: hypothetical protein ACOYPR_17065 [Saprospiraceae bacterium]
MTGSQKVSIPVQTELDLDSVLKGLDQLGAPEVEQFLQQVGGVLARKRSTGHLSERESDLIMKINQAIPQQEQVRFSLLTVQSEERLLSLEEHNELTGLTEVLEACYAERLRWLVELAQLRGVSLGEVMNGLEIKIIDSDG